MEAEDIRKNQIDDGWYKEFEPIRKQAIYEKKKFLEIIKRWNGDLPLDVKDEIQKDIDILEGNNSLYAQREPKNVSAENPQVAGKCSSKVVSPSAKGDFSVKCDYCPNRANYQLCKWCCQKIAEMWEDGGQDK